MNRRYAVLLALVLPALLAPAIPAGKEDRTNKIPDAPRAILEQAGQIELLSLDPARQKEKPKDDFHGWKVLGKTIVKDATVCQRLVAALKKGVRDNKGIAAACFNPRHGIRVVHQGKV